MLTIKPDTAFRLRVRTERLLRIGFASATEMRQTIGSWIWACLLNRSLLSILDTVFDFMSCENEEQRRRLPRAVRIELHMLLDLFPLRYADLGVEFSTRVYTSDASTQGGVTYCDMSAQQLRNFL